MSATEALRRAHEATTQGEWGISAETRGDEICTIHGVPVQPTEDGLRQEWVYIHYQNVQDGGWHWAGPDEKIANAHFIALAHKEVPALIDRIEALEADAARYRWLRDVSEPPHNFYVAVPDEFSGTRYRAEEVDAYIDAARAVLGEQS